MRLATEYRFCILQKRSDNRLEIKPLIPTFFYELNFNVYIKKISYKISYLDKILLIF